MIKNILIAIKKLFLYLSVFIFLIILPYLLLFAFDVQMKTVFQCYLILFSVLLLVTVLATPLIRTCVLSFKSENKYSVKFFINLLSATCLIFYSFHYTFSAADHFSFKYYCMEYEARDQKLVQSIYLYKFKNGVFPDSLNVLQSELFETDLLYLQKKDNFKLCRQAFFNLDYLSCYDLRAQKWNDGEPADAELAALIEKNNNKLF